MRHRDRLTATSPTPRDELAATIERGRALLPALTARLAPLVAATSDPDVVRALIDAEVRRLLAELAAATSSEAAKRALLGLDGEVTE